MYAAIGSGDFNDRLSNFNAEFLVIGGFALAAYGRPRYTKDRDLWVDPVDDCSRRYRDRHHRNAR